MPAMGHWTFQRRGLHSQAGHLGDHHGDGGDRAVSTDAPESNVPGLEGHFVGQLDRVDLAGVVGDRLYDLVEVLELGGQEDDQHGLGLALHNGEHKSEELDKEGSGTNRGCLVLQTRRPLCICPRLAASQLVAA
jgi:hypothetical protein